MNDREIEVRCSEPGCISTTTAQASKIDSRMGYEVGAPKEDGWQVPGRRGMDTGAGLTWVYGTCPKHAKP